jgi:hypothetical protein
VESQIIFSVPCRGAVSWRTALALRFYWEIGFGAALKRNGMYWMISAGQYLKYLNRTATILLTTESAMAGCLVRD